MCELERAYRPQIYSRDPATGLRVVFSRPRTQGRPRGLECFLEELVGGALSVEARGHGGRPLGP